jgi:phage protein D
VAELLLSEAWRLPKLRAIANGRVLEGVLGAEITSTNQFSADSFSATFALGAYPASSAAFWTDTPSITLSLSLSADSVSYQELIQGNVDIINVDIGRGLVRVEGRDFTSVFIESQIAETFPNRTASEIAELLAARHGLGAFVTPTTTPVGRYYQNEHDTTLLDSLSQAATEWDFLVWLARREGFDVFVSGTTLYFNPSATGLAVRIIDPQMLMGLRLERSLILGRNITVTVKSWNSAQNTVVVQVAQSNGATLGSGTQTSASSTLNFVIVRPNLTQDQALQLAQRKLAELIRHERTVEFTMPGDTNLAPRDGIVIRGTGTSFDQPFYVDCIERSVGPGGFIQRVRATNNS